MIFFFNDTATTEIYTLSLHDALPICSRGGENGDDHRQRRDGEGRSVLPHDRKEGHPRAEYFHRKSRSEEHTSELQSPCNLVCRLLLEKKKNTKQTSTDSNRYTLSTDI